MSGRGAADSSISPAVGAQERPRWAPSGMILPSGMTLSCQARRQRCMHHAEHRVTMMLRAMPWRRLQYRLSKCELRASSTVPAGARPTVKILTRGWYSTCKRRGYIDCATAGACAQFRREFDLFLADRREHDIDASIHAHASLEIAGVVGARRAPRAPAIAIAVATVDV